MTAAGDSLPILLGVCQSALVRGDGISHDLRAFGKQLLLPFFPHKLEGPSLVLAFPTSAAFLKRQVHIHLRARSGRSDVAFCTLDLLSHEEPNSPTRATGFSRPYQIDNTASERQLCGVRILLDQHAPYNVLTLPCPPLTVWEPSIVDVTVKDSTEERSIGSFGCVHLPPAPLTEQEREAILSHPKSSKRIQFRIACDKCGSTLNTSLTLRGEDSAIKRADSSTPLSDLPNEWSCECRNLHVPLVYLKKGLHELFRRPLTVSENVTFVPSFEANSICAIRQKLQELIDTVPNREDVFQEFIERNQIVWNFLAPLAIWKQPAILTDYRADFAIESRNHVLYLVEIEKPGTKLIKKNGGMHSQLQTGFDQLREWRRVVDRHRVAFLDSLNLSADEIQDVRYVLIAGLVNRVPFEHAEKLRKDRNAADIFLGFDDLVTHLYSTEMTLRLVG